MKPRLWTKQFSLIVMITFLFFLAMHILNAGFPVYLTEMSNNPALGGTMTTAFMLAAIFTRPVVSIFLPSLHAKKAIWITILCLIFSIVLSFGKSYYPFLIAIRIIEGIGFGIITTLMATYATAIAPGSRLGEGVGYFAMATSLGASLAPFAALSIIHVFSFNSVLVLSLFIIIGILGCCYFIKNIEFNRVQSDQYHKTSIFQNVFDKNALFPSILVFLLCVTFGGVFNFIDGLGQESGIGAKISIFFLVFMVMMVVVRPAAGIIFDKSGHKMLIYPAGFCSLTGLILLSFTDSLWILIFAAVFYGIGYGATHPSLQSWAVSEVNANKKGTANAMILTGMDLGMAIGSPFLGFAAGEIGYRAMFGYSSIFILVLLVLYLIKSILSKKSVKAIEKESGSNSSEA